MSTKKQFLPTGYFENNIGAVFGDCLLLYPDSFVKISHFSHVVRFIWCSVPFVRLAGLRGAAVCGVLFVCKAYRVIKRTNTVIIPL